MNGNTRSGLYLWSSNSGFPFSREELRLDVDGFFPQNVASGTGFSGLTFRIHWVARPLVSQPLPNGIGWSGPIFFKQGSSGLFPYTEVVIEQTDTSTQVTFTGPGLPDLIRQYTFQSPFFREVMLEYDAEEGVDLTLEYQTDAHPDRPAALPTETLTINTVFERVGFRVISGEDSIVSEEERGRNLTWSNMEMHDAMQVHFSQITQLPPRLRNLPQWALWTFFARLHDDGPGLGGIMFDSIGRAERQGTALFTESFIADPPPLDPNPQAWIQRMTFWTAIHEMGHAFNLLHAWQKTLGTPWLPQEDSYDLLSYMNYPFFYQDGNNPDRNTQNFFRDFMFRFSDDEIFFMRHAPEAFVQMGNADFATNHAFEQARLSSAPTFALDLASHRPGHRYEFLEPVVIEMQLTNLSSQPQLIDERILQLTDQMTVIVRRRGGAEMVYRSYAQACFKPQVQVLGPSESMVDSLFISVGSKGWMIDAPGWYEVQICLHLDTEDIVSNPLPIRVTLPADRQEEILAQDYFCDQVGRVLSFDGSQWLTQANDVLSEVSAQCSSPRVKIHTEIALNLPQIKPYKRMVPLENGSLKIELVSSDERAVISLAQTLASTSDQAKLAADALGDVDASYYFRRVAQALQTVGNTRLELDAARNLYKAFEDRRANILLLQKLQHFIRQIE